MLIFAAEDGPCEKNVKKEGERRGVLNLANGYHPHK